MKRIRISLLLGCVLVPQAFCQQADAVAHVNRGISLAHAGRYDEAIAEYEAAEKLLPGDPRIALNEALAYEKSGRIQEAAQRFAALHNSYPGENKVTLLLADCELQLGEDQKVIDLLQPVEAANAGDLGFAYMLGTALIRKQRIQEGQVFLDRILRNGDTPQARFLLGTRMFASGDYPAAVKQLAAAIELDPNLPQLQSFYGRALLLTGDPDGAEAAFRKELSGHPNDYDANLGLGQILAERKQFAEALPFFEHAASLRPESGEPRVGRGECFAHTGELQKARVDLEFAAKSMPDSLDAHQNLAAVYAGLKMRADAAREQAIAAKLEAAARGAEPGPKVGEAAPSFVLPDSISHKLVRLDDVRRKSGAVVVFGSYSCPNFRSSADEIRRLHQKYGSRIPFLLVYIREAHARGEWQSTRNEREGVELAPAMTLGDREQHAIMCSRKLHLPFSAVVDGMDGAVEKAYAAWPSRLFVINKDGRIRYSTRLTEFDFHPEELQTALRHLDH